jgi:hypothetical protein
VITSTGEECSRYVSDVILNNAELQDLIRITAKEHAIPSVITTRMQLVPNS